MADNYALRRKVSLLTWLTSSEAALYCAVSEATFSGMVHSIPIPYVCPAGPNSHRRFLRADLDAALMSRRQNVGTLPAA